MNTRPLICLMLLFAACAPFKFPDVRLAQTPEGAKYAGTGAATLLASDTIELKKHGDVVAAKLTRYRRVKVFALEGVKAAEIHLPFNAKMRLAYYDGRTLVTDDAGQERAYKLDAGETVIKRPFEGDGAPEIGEAVFTLPNVKPGAVFDYVAIYEVPDAVLLDPIVMRSSTPTDRAEVTILAPKSLNLDMHYIEGGQTKIVNPAPASDAPASLDSHRFVMLDLPGLTREEMMPAPVRIGPAIWAAYREDKDHEAPPLARWEDVGQWVVHRYGLPAPPSGGGGDLEKVQAAFRQEALKLKVNEDFLKIGERASEGASGGGHDRVFAGLELYRTLALRGFSVALGLVGREESAVVLPDIPSPAAIDAVVVAFDDGGHVVYFDPACPSCPQNQVSSELEGAPVVAVLARGAVVENLPARSSRENAFVLSFEGELKTRGQIKGQLKAVASGAPAAMARAAFLKKDNNELLKELGLAKGLIVDKVSSPDAQAGAQTFEVDFEAAAQAIDDGSGKLKVSAETFLEKLLPLLWREARTQDLLLPETFSSQLVVSLRLPNKARVEAPAPVQLKGKFSEYAIGAKADAVMLTLSRHFALNARRIGSGAYEDFYRTVAEARRLDTTPAVIALFAEGEAPQGAPEAAEKTKIKPAMKIKAGKAKRKK